MPISHFQTHATAVITTELQAISSLINRIDDNFDRACDILRRCEGRIVVTGMGKSGHIGGKIAATLASTGSPAFFVHPGEACHGDLGMITPRDTVLGLSYSGSTDEIIKILPIIQHLNVPLISLTGYPQSPLGKASSVVLNVSIDKEACPLDLAPTSSTTAMLVMGDALAIALMQSRGFTKEDFALSHPGGSLGRRLLLRVSDLMHANEAVPAVKPEASLAESLIEITRKRLGMTTIVDEENRLLGIFTDGDLRRTLGKQSLDLHRTPISDVMTQHSKSITPDTRAVDALQIMEQHLITSLPVVDETECVVGLLHMHDLLGAGVIS